MPLNVISHINGAEDMMYIVIVSGGFLPLSAVDLFSAIAPGYK